MGSFTLHPWSLPPCRTVKIATLRAHYVLLFFESVGLCAGMEHNIFSQLIVRLILIIVAGAATTITPAALAVVL